MDSKTVDLISNLDVNLRNSVGASSASSGFGGGGNDDDDERLVFRPHSSSQPL